MHITLVVLVCSKLYVRKLYITMKKVLKATLHISQNAAI